MVYYPSFMDDSPSEPAGYSSAPRRQPQSASAVCPFTGEWLRTSQQPRREVPSAFPPLGLNLGFTAAWAHHQNPFFFFFLQRVKVLFLLSQGKERAGVEVCTCPEGLGLWASIGYGVVGEQDVSVGL